jgi:hypothetical protein
VGIGGYISSGVKRKGREADHSPHLVPRSRMVDLCILSPICLHGTVLNYIIKYRDNFEEYHLLGYDAV